MGCVCPPVRPPGLYYSKPIGVSVGQSRLQLASTFRPHRPCSPTPISTASPFPGPLGSPSSQMPLHPRTILREPSQGTVGGSGSSSPNSPSERVFWETPRPTPGHRASGSWPSRTEGSRDENIRMEETQRVGNGCTCRVGMSVVSEASVPPLLPLRLPQGWGLHCSPKLLELKTGKR